MLKTDDNGELQVPIELMGRAQRFLPVAHHRRHSLRRAWPIWATPTSGPSATRCPPPDHAKVYTITDRPVYRPGSPVRFWFWVARARYDLPDATEFAGRPFTVVIQNPKGEKVLTKEFTADKFGGLRRLVRAPPPTRHSGSIRFSFPTRGGGSFRVEEYKKPEFKVTVLGTDQTKQRTGPKGVRNEWRRNRRKPSPRNDLRYLLNDHRIMINKNITRWQLLTIYHHQFSTNLSPRVLIHGAQPRPRFWRVSCQNAQYAKSGARQRTNLNVLQGDSP